MSISDAIMIVDDEAALVKRIEYLLSPTEGEIRLVTINEEMVASFDVKPPMGHIMVLGSNRVVGIVTMIVCEYSQNNPSRDELLSQVGLIGGFGSPGRSDDAIFIAKLSAYRFSDSYGDSFSDCVMRINRVAPRKFSGVRNIPIPVQCKNAKTSHYPGMRKR